LGNRIFFVSDLHGSDKCFRKFVNAAKFYRADILILGGDITGKVLIPIVHRADSTFSFSLFGKDVSVKQSSLAEYVRMLRDAGQYYFMVDEKELQEISSDRRKVDKIFSDCMVSVVKDWVSLANEKLKGTGVMCYISPGNDDRFEIDGSLVDSGAVVNPENRVVTLDGRYEMITLGFANPTPWNSPREVPEEKLSSMIESLAGELTEPARSIFNLHVPPHGTEIDKAPAVDKEFNYVKQGMGAVKIIPAGSTAVRSALEKYHPLLGLHGHIHESRGFVRIGPTLCVNPGSEYSDGILRGALLNLEDGKVKEFMLTTG
jgi:Icc-related predicted phosphoesterase